MKKSKKIISVLAIIIMIVTALSSAVRAADVNLLTQATGSLEITKYDTNYKTEEGTLVTEKPVNGAVFAIYKVAEIYDDIPESTEIPVEDTKTAQTKQTATTGENGKVKFENLSLGRYLVVEESVPAGTTGRIANFLIDIPTTKEGTGFIYDVSIAPKNNISYGTATLIKQNEEGMKLEGVTFLLVNKVLGETDKWVPYTDENGNNIEVTTDSNGQASIEGLPEGVYGFVEKSLGEANKAAGYILDNNTVHEFEVLLNEQKQTVVSEIAPIINEKPAITKTIEKVTTVAGTNTKIDEGDATRSANKGDTITYKVVTTVPTVIAQMENYKITDIMDSNLTFAGSLDMIKGIKRETKDGEEGDEIIPEAEYKLIPAADNHSWDLTFTSLETLEKYSKIELTYDAIFSNNVTKSDEDNSEYKNMAILTYSNEVSTKYDGTPNEPQDITTNDSLQIQTGGLKIEKHANNVNGDLLSGAEFKLAISETNAKFGTFIKDENGNDITITTAGGIASHYGLAYGTYYLVETKAPEGFNLMNKAKEIEISANSYETAVKVINKSGIQLPVTGGSGSLIFIAIGVIAIGTGIVLHIRNKKQL